MSPRLSRTFQVALRSAIAVLVLFLSFTAPGLAQSDSIPPKPQLDVHRRAAAITIDGDLSDEGWRTAARTNSFVTAIPIAYQQPVTATDAMITYDDENLYVAMIAHDPDPTAIRASMVSRDRIFNDDFMGIILDTYGDATKAFELYVNPRGVQGDLFWSSTNEDEGYDMIYDAEAKITSDGWQMEMRIPFSSLRFPETAVQNFHISFWRNYPRESVYKFTWAPINFAMPCTFCQLGVLTGIENVHPSGSLELLPALVTSQAATRADGAAVSQPLTNDKVALKPSLGARFALGTATAVEAAIKPDFSQVESDAAQVSANATFALFYPERRPFFQDGSDLWNTYLSAVYTRSMSTPLAAAKVLHRDGNSSYAILSSYDDNTPIIIPLEERSVFVFDDHRSFSNVLRATHTFDDDRYVGLLATDRRYAGNGSNTVLGVDARMRLFENVVAYGQQLFSLTREQSGAAQAGDTALFDDARHSVEFNGESFNGNANTIALERMSQTFDAHIDYSQTSPTFRAGNGFITQNDIRAVSGWIGYKYPLVTKPEWLSWLVEIDGSLVGSHDWNYDGYTKHDIVRPQIDMTLIGQSDLHVMHQRWNERFANVDFPGLYRTAVRGSTRFTKMLGLSWNWETGRMIYYDPTAPNVGRETNLTLSGSVKPFDGLLFEASYTFSALRHLSDDATFYRGSIYWTKTTYQFTRALDLRVVAQYDGFAQQILIDPLVTYRVNPFTSFYLGSTHQFLSSSPNSPDATQVFHPTDRQFFAKIQYLIQT